MGRHVRLPPNLDICPPTLQSPEGRNIAVTHSLRPVTAENSSEQALPGWFRRLPARSTVYVTLGTVFKRDLDVFAASRGSP